MVDFSKLKKSSGSNISRLTEALEKQNNKNFVTEDEEGYWKIERDKAGNGYARIRFLPAAPQDGDDGLPWVKYFRYSFQGPGGWYINRSLVSLDQADPAAEHYFKLKNSGKETQAKLINRTQHWVSNIKVISYPKHPEDEGKVFKFSYGKKIFDKITEKMNPSFAGEEGIDIFDFWNGCDFIIKVKTITDGDRKFPNYDNSEWGSPSPLSKDDEELEKIWKSQYSLKEVMDLKYFKSYDSLKVELYRALGLNTTTETSQTVTEQEEDKKPEVLKAKPKTKVTEQVVKPDTTEDTEEDEDIMNHFKKLANDDVPWETE